MIRKGLLLVVLLTAASFAYANQPDNCPPDGAYLIGPQAPYFEYIANGVPGSSGCWSKQLVVWNNAYFLGMWSPLWDFQTGGTGVLTQTFVVDRSVQQLDFTYKLDFEDPHYDPSNMFFSTITDMTTGRVLYSDSWYGSWGTYGGQRGPGLIPYYNLVDLNGHTIQVQFAARKAQSDVTIYLRAISLHTPAPY